MSGVSRRHRYAAAAGAVLLLAIALRFHGLSDGFLSYDEAVAALNSRGALPSVLDSTRAANSSPILWPLALWAAQQVESTNFSVRFLSAAGSSLTVAALLFLLPGAGIPRWAALCAGALAALSASAIVEAQGVREYSADALFAVLLIAGLLRFVRTGGRALLAIGLFLAPQVQYGLVLFGSAVLGTAAIFGGGGPPERRRESSGPVRRRAGLLLPALSFAAGSVAAYLLTLRFHISGDASPVFRYLSSHYYEGGPSDSLPVLSFVVSGTWDLVRSFLPGPVAAALFGSVGLIALFAARRRFRRTGSPSRPAARPAEPGAERSPEAIVSTLFAAVLLIAVAAALLRLYPLGGIRQTTYLGPVFWVTSGLVFRWIAERLGSLFPRRARPVVLAGFVLAGAAAAGAALAREGPYGRSGDPHRFLALLDERAEVGDLVYVSGEAGPVIRFYRGERTPDYTEGVWCPDFRRCAQEVFELLTGRAETPRGLLLVTGDREVGEVAHALEERFEGIVPDEVPMGARPVGRRGPVTDHPLRAWSVGNLGEVTANAKRRRWDEYAAGLGADRDEPVARSRFDLHLRNSFLAWHRDPCLQEEVGDRFFLHLFRHDRVGSGARRLFENRDFDFPEHGGFVDGACLAVFRLPEGVASVRTGQRSPGQPGHWSEVVRVDFAPFRAEIEEIVSGRAGPPAARGVFDLYREGTELRYFKDECRPEDREVPFFLQLHAADPEALPEHRREDGFEDLDFAFSHHGAVLDGRCLLRVTIPDYEMRRLRTGQGFRDGEPVWEVDIRPGAVTGGESP